MPEIAEVRLMRDFINTKSNAVVFNKATTSTVTKHPLGNWPCCFTLRAEARGKELQLILNKKDKITFTMGMTGNWLWKKRHIPVHSHLLLESKQGVLVMHDIRRFAKWKNRDWNKDRGPDPISENQQFKENILKHVKTNKQLQTHPLHQILLNQKWFNGVGNYLVAEILGRLDVDPFQSLYNLYQTDILNFMQLFELCKNVPEEAYQLGGGQFKDWKNAFEVDSTQFKEWIQFYRKDTSVRYKTKTGRSFWHHPKWSKV